MRKDGTGLLFETRKPMDFSALPYTPHELENARHSFELPRAGKTVVRTALRQMGVGGRVGRKSVFEILEHGERLLAARW